MIELFHDFIQSGVGQALTIAAVTAIVARMFTPKGKLIWAVSHQHHYRMPSLGDGTTFPVVTQQIWFQNTGTSSIQDIEIVLNWKPQHFEIWDPRQWDKDSLPDGRFVLKVPSLYSQEFFTLSMIDTINELPIVLNVRWLGGRGKKVSMGPQRLFPMWFNWTALALIFAGIVSILYIALQVII